MITEEVKEKVYEVLFLSEVIATYNNRDDAEIEKKMLNDIYGNEVCCVAEVKRM